MGEVIKLDKMNERKSLLSHLIFGTPYEFSFFGKKYKSIGVPYKLKKQREFLDGYWEHFIRGLNDLNPNQEFNINYISRRYNSLSEVNQFAVRWECSETYAFNGRLNYSDFVDSVNSFFSEEDSSFDFDPSDFNGVA